jgi:hypothetical protein
MCGPRSAFGWVRGVKHRRTIFYALVGQSADPKNLCVMTHYVELVFPVLSAGHVTHFSASEAWNVDAQFLCSSGPGVDPIKSVSRHVTPNLCFYIWCDVSRSAFGCVQGVKHRPTIFHALVGLVRILEKVRHNTLRRTCIFASITICGSRSTFCCVRCAKYQRTIFHARVGSVRIP